MGLFGFAAPALSVAAADLPALGPERAGAASPAPGVRLGRLAKQTFPDLERRRDAYLVALFDQSDFDRVLGARVAPLRTSGIDDATRE